MKLSDLSYRVTRRTKNEFHDLALKYGLTGARGLNLRFLFSCRRGIYLFDRGRVSELIPGAHFGITAAPDDTVYVAEWVGDRDIQKTVVCRYDFDGERLRQRSQLEFRDASGQTLQPYGIHQLRYLNGCLWVVNTRENVVWKCTLDGEVLSEWSEEGKMPFDAAHFVEGNRLRKQTESYRHYNSISYKDGHYYVLAHNCTQDHADLSKKSYIVRLDEDLQVVERIPDAGRACHDVLFVGEDTYVCSSFEGQLRKNGEPFMDLGGFLRGLGLIGSVLVVGGSPIHLDRKARDFARSKLFFIDLPARRKLLELELGRLGNVLDLLMLDA